MTPTGSTKLTRSDTGPRFAPMGSANVNVEPIADFSAFKSYMLMTFAAIGIGSCIFVQDFSPDSGICMGSVTESHF